MSQILNLELKNTSEWNTQYIPVILPIFRIKNIFEEKSSSGLVQNNKFHNFLNAATKPETPPKDRDIS